jgi:glycerol dehydrogenase-like iron-containing ADH family enzyme
MELAELKQAWNDVLDVLERENRVAWLVFFDARLVKLIENTLTLDFLDRNKLAANHDFESHISQDQLHALKAAIHSITGKNLEISIAK